MDTFFKLPPKRLYPLRSPQNNPHRILMIKKRFRNSIIKVKTYAGADIGSEHNLLVGTIRPKLKKSNNE